MSRIPYLDKLGDEFERAITESQPHRPRAMTVAVAAFALVMVAGASLWLLRGGQDPDIAEATTTTATPQPEVASDLAAIPGSWARIPQEQAFTELERTTLSAVATTPTGFVAVGTAGTDTTRGVMLESSDGIEWSVLITVPDVALQDVDFGPTGVIAAGLDVRGHMPVVVDGDGSVADLPVLPGTGERAINTFGIAATDSGFVVVGVEQAFEDHEGKERPAVWWSADGIAWEPVDSPAFGWHSEAAINDVVVSEGHIVAVGLVGEEPGTTTAAAWVSSDGVTWEHHEMPAPVEGGFTGASALAFGHGRFMAVGFAPSPSGRVGTAWTSGDGRTWDWVDDGDLAGVEKAETWIHSVAVVTDGFVAVGTSFDAPTSHHVIWTADRTGSAWERFDLADPGQIGATSANDVAVSTDLVILIGTEFGISFVEASAAVWVGPAPSTLEASGPLVTTTTTEPPPDAVSLSLDPAEAVSATSVRVVGRLPVEFVNGEILVELVADDGTTIEFCRAVRQGRNFMCRATLADLEPQPAAGTYEVVAAAVGDSQEPVLLEVLADGTQIVRLTGVYTPTYGPLLQTLSVQNKGGEDVDLTDWSIVNENRDDPRFDFPDGAVLPPGKSAILDFSGAMGAFCPDDDERYFHWCNTLTDSDRIDYWDEEALWKGGTLQLLDDAGNVVSEWRPGS